MIPAIVLLVLIYVCPESPRFLIRQSRYKEAYQSLRRLRGTEIQAARDMYAIHSQLQIETAIILGDTTHQWYNEDIYQREIKKLSWWQRIFRLFEKRNRRACLSSFLVMASQQLCGVST